MICEEPSKVLNCPQFAKRDTEVQSQEVKCPQSHVRYSCCRKSQRLLSITSPWSLLLYLSTGSTLAFLQSWHLPKRNGTRSINVIHGAPPLPPPGSGNGRNSTRSKTSKITELKTSTCCKQKVFVPTLVLSFPCDLCYLVHDTCLWEANKQWEVPESWGKSEHVHSILNLST